MLNQSTRRFIVYFGSAYPRRTALLIGLLVLAGLSEAMGVASLLPVLDVLSRSEGHRSLAALSVERLLAAVGVTPSLPALLVLVVLAMVLKAGFRLLAMQQVGYTVAHVTTDLRLRLLRALIGSSWPYFIGQPAGRFANAVGTEATRAAGAYRAACSLFAAFVQAAVYTGIAMLVSWQVALMAIGAGVLIVLALSWAVAMMRDAGDRQTVALRTLTSRLTDALAGIKAIKAMGREDKLQPLLEHETEALNLAQQKQVLAGELLASVQEPILVVLLSLGIFLGAGVFGLPLGYVFMLGFIFYRLAGRISAMQSEYQGIAYGETAFESLLDATQSATDARESTAGTLDPALAHELVLDAVSFSYGENPVLREASLRIGAGEFVTMIGASGAGKTTVIDLLVGFYQPTAGSVLVDGRDLRELDLRRWRRYVGYVPQETFLFHDTVRENVTLGDESVTDEQVRNSLALAGADEFMRELPAGMHTILGERGARLSGGQRQRLGLARALLRQPALLILDEVTSALDVDTERGICRTLTTLPGDVTILAVSHQPGFLEAADRIVRLENGAFTELTAAETHNLALGSNGVPAR